MGTSCMRKPLLFRLGNIRMFHTQQSHVCPTCARCSPLSIRTWQHLQMQAVGSRTFLPCLHSLQHSVTQVCHVIAQRVTINIQHDCTEPGTVQTWALARTHHWGDAFADRLPWKEERRGVCVCSHATVERQRSHQRGNISKSLHQCV